MEYLPGLPQDTKPLRSCSGIERRCFSKGILESNVTLNITRSSDSFSTVPSIVNAVDWIYIVHYFTWIQFHPSKVTPLTNLDEVTIHGLCYGNSNAWRWHNSYHSGVVGIFFQITLTHMYNNGSQTSSWRDHIAMSDVLSEFTVGCNTLQDVACSDHCVITFTLNLVQLPMLHTIERHKKHAHKLQI